MSSQCSKKGARQILSSGVMVLRGRDSGSACGPIPDLAAADRQDPGRYGKHWTGPVSLGTGTGAGGLSSCRSVLALYLTLGKMGSRLSNSVKQHILWRHSRDAALKTRQRQFLPG